MNDIYNRYSDYLKDHYGCRVYKLPVNIPVTCPNRTDGKGGCTYCDEKGAGFDNLSGIFSVCEQIEKNMEYIGKKYKAQKFTAYFQNFTNTYLPLNKFKEYINDACMPNIVEISVSTRPDCIREEYLEALKDASEKHNVEITVELGLQSINPHTLKKINRGHTFAEFAQAVMLIKKFGFLSCAHLILNLPWDDMEDSIEASKLMSVFDVDFIKLHSLYIAEGTQMAKQYKNNEFEVCSLDEYRDRVVQFLRYLSPKACVERIVSRAPKENTLFANWDRSSWYVRDYIENYMRENGFYQGQLYNYGCGKALDRFF